MLKHICLIAAVFNAAAAPAPDQPAERHQLFSSHPGPGPSPPIGDLCPLPVDTVKETIEAILAAVAELDITCIVYYAVEGGAGSGGFTACILRAVDDLSNPVASALPLLRPLSFPGPPTPAHAHRAPPAPSSRRPHHRPSSPPPDCWHPSVPSRHPLVHLRHPWV